MIKFRILAVVLFLFTVPVLHSQEIDETYNNKIKEFTTDKQFLPETVMDLVDHPEIPSPLKHFGKIIGAEGSLHRSEEIYGYYRKLAETSPRIEMQEMGRSEEGRPFYLIIIGSEKTINNLDLYKERLSKLADPRKVKAEEVENLVRDSKPVYYLSGGMHSPEMGSPEMLMELAFRLATSQDDEIEEIRNEIIVTINPIAEPDGWDKQVDWYYRYTKGREKFDDGFPRSAPFWGKYVFHDNNRDGLQVSQGITRAIYRGFFEFHPTVMLDLHESVPLLYISTGTGPYNEYVDPITVGEWQTMANHDITSLASQGLPGAFTWAFYDGWWPGYGIWVANNHNSNGRFYETFGNAGADTYLRDLSGMNFAGDPVTSREWYRPDPPTQEVYWSFRNNINYMQAGVIASLSYAARNAETLLRNFYLKGVNSIQKGKEEGPKAFVINKQQRDPSMVTYLVNQLRAQAIEVHENDSSFVVLTEQPYRNLAVNLLTKQEYPKDAKFPPYDAIAWTLGYLYGVEIQAKDSIDFKTNNLTKLTQDAVYKGTVTGKGKSYLLKYQAQNNVLPAMYALKSGNKEAGILTLNRQKVIKGDTLPAGSVLFRDIDADGARQLTEEFGLDLLKANPDLKEDQLEIVELPRIGIYRSWYSTQDEGWTRYTFDERGIPYTSIDKDDLKEGNLNSKFDVILVPRIGGSAKHFIHGIEEKYGPMPYTKTADFPSHGYPASTSDMTGGPGFSGINNLKKFVEEGGLLITLDNSTAIIAETGITTELFEVNQGNLFHPGSIVQVKTRDKNSPVLYGFPEFFSIYRGNAPLLGTDKYHKNMMLLQYGTKPLKEEEDYKGPVMGMSDKPKSKEDKNGTEAKDLPYVLSGMVRNEQQIIGHGSIFNVPVGKGRILGFTFDPLHRYLNHHDAPMVWNALIHWNRLEKKKEKE